MTKQQTYFVVGRKRDEKSPPEFAAWFHDDGRLTFTTKLMLADKFETIADALKALRPIKPREKAGTEVLEVFARRPRLESSGR